MRPRPRRCADHLKVRTSAHQADCAPSTLAGFGALPLCVFTLAHIDELRARLGRADSLADYLRGLAAVGVVRFDSFVGDGHSEFFSADGRRIVSPSQHEVLAVADVSDRSTFLEHLRCHSAGDTSYLEMSKGLADSGVERWVADTTALTMTHLDRGGAVLLVEQVE